MILVGTNSTNLYSQYDTYETKSRIRYGFKLFVAAPTWIPCGFNVEDHTLLPRGYRADWTIWFPHLASMWISRGSSHVDSMWNQCGRTQRVSTWMLHGRTRVNSACSFHVEVSWKHPRGFNVQSKWKTTPKLPYIVIRKHSHGIHVESTRKTKSSFLVDIRLKHSRGFHMNNWGSCTRWYTSTKNHVVSTWKLRGSTCIPPTTTFPPRIHVEIKFCVCWVNSQYLDL